MRIRNTSLGFTLIELIVVIAILAVLGLIAYIAINPENQFKRARDVQRRTALRSLQTALQQYYQDKGEYPKTAGVTGCVSNWCGETSFYGNHKTDYIPGLVPGYLKKLPNDPKAGVSNTGISGGCLDGNQVTYLYRSDDGQSYALLAHCSPETPNTLNNNKDPFYDSARPSWAWKICTGAGCGY